MSDTPSNLERATLGKRMMWFVILWLLGFAGTMLLAMPFQLLVTIAMHH
jgi:hypothetical protein